MHPAPEEFRDAWPRVVRALAAWSGSLDVAEEYAALAIARAVEHDGAIDDLAAWCVQVGKRARIDEVRRAAVLDRLRPDLAREEVSAVDVPEIDDRVALLFVACDGALAPAAQMVLALRVVCGLTIAEIATHLGVQETTAAARLTRAKAALARARGEFAVPDATERERRLPVVLDCVAAMFTVAHRGDLEPADPVVDLGRSALSIADALVALHPADTEARGLRAVVRLGLARRPGRVDDDGVALTLAEVDRTRWDGRLLAAGLADATYAARGGGRFALEAAISGLHSVAPDVEHTDWAQLTQLYLALERVWPSPAVRVARLAAATRAVPADSDEHARVEAELGEIAAGGPAYARRDASYALADLCWRTGRRGEAAGRYRALAETATEPAVRRFCERRASGRGTGAPPVVS